MPKTSKSFPKIFKERIVSLGIYIQSSYPQSFIKASVKPLKNMRKFREYCHDPSLRNCWMTSSIQPKYRWESIAREMMVNIECISL